MPGKNKPVRALVLIPSYNTGAKLLARTVEAALRQSLPVWVVIDGSTDGSERALEPLQASAGSHLRVIRLPENRGKGAAIEAGARVAREAGFTHLLTMDADGQHPAESIPELLAAAEENPRAIIMGAPVFGEDAPKARLYGRKLTKFWTDVETLWCGLGDTLFGMRVYPLEALLEGFGRTRWGRGFDFDPELAVRLVWGGCRPLQVPVPCRYLGADEGGVSHFHYLRDNIRLTCLHLRLLPEFVFLRPWIHMHRRWRAGRG